MSLPIGEFRSSTFANSNKLYLKTNLDNYLNLVRLSFLPFKDVHRPTFQKRKTKDKDGPRYRSKNTFFIV